MSLVRAWTRALGGASSAALLVPAGVFAAMALLALSGSFGQLGQLGQAFAGPSTPSALRAASAPAPSAGQATLVPLVSARATTLGISSAAVGVRGVGVGGVLPAAPTAKNPGGSTPPPAGTPTSTPPTGGAPSCASGCAAAPKPTAIDQVLGVGSSITSTLPAPVGQLTTQAVKQVGATVDQVGSGNTGAGVAQLGAAATAATGQLGSALNPR